MRCGRAPRLRLTETIQPSTEPMAKIKNRRSILKGGEKDNLSAKLSGKLKNGA